MKPEQRSALMSRIRSKNTKPELFVRSLVFSMGYRYRLHQKDLPGKPDLVFASRKKVIFVNGCFWHAHTCGLGFRPKSNVDFWEKKLEGNRLRDARNLRQLRALGWKCLTVWECHLANPAKVEKRIRHFLECR